MLGRVGHNFKTQLLQRGHIGQQRGTLDTGNRQRAQFASQNLGHGRVDVHERAVYLSAKQIDHDRTTAFVGHMYARGVGLLPEQLGRQVITAAIARGGRGTRSAYSR